MLLLKQLTTWRTTDRVLFPILDFLDAAGHGDIVDAVRRERSVQSAEFVAKDKDGDAGVYMTRDALHRLRDQIEKIEVALRTTIPEAIRTAREHGDLSENAEYDAAKEKQARENQRLSQFQELIGKARVIEDASRAEGVAAPGTLVRTLDLTTNAENEYWILGEGDTFHGSNVISYRAPLGAALAGHRVGEDVTVFLEGGERHLRIVDVSEKLP